MVLNTEWAQVEVIDLINDGTGLAFGIIGGRSTGVVVKTILPGGVADRDGRLQSGDHILQIGEVNLRGLGSEQVASVLRQCGVRVRMVVARPIESANADFQTLSSLAPIVPTRILGDPVELDRHLTENGYGEAFAFRSSPPAAFDPNPYIYSGHPDIRFQVLVDPLSMPYIARADIQNSLPKIACADRQANEAADLPETETFVVELTKDDLGLGITVAGYVCEKEEISGIFVKSISKGSAADLTQNIQINDRIIQVNGISVLGFTNHRAVEMLRNAGSTVTLKLERYLRGPKYEQLQQAIKANELRPPSPPSPTLTSLPKVLISSTQMDYLGIEPDDESRTSFEFDSAVLLDSATPVNEEKEIVIGGERRSSPFAVESYENIYDKWRERLEGSVEIVIAQMPKDVGIGLGISLEGTVDVEDGKEVRPHHYIRNILPDGPVGKNGVLKSGDELLEVNGVQLLGLNHLEVVSILKQLPNFVSLTCARYPVPIRIIDTSQHRDAFRARKIFAGSLQTLALMNENNFLVKAKSESSLASSMASEPVSRSRSLELTSGLPMWREEPTVVELVKGEHGLGFSILDYQDPLDPQETAIVIRSLVPGGVAQNDGGLVPGDRLLAVNDVDLGHSSLDRAVQVLKGAPRGIVRVIVAKPLSGVDATSHNSQDTEEDQTCLEDFQECIEEFQECLDAVHLGMDDDNYFFNHSPGSSQVEDFGRSDVDASFESANDKTVETRAKFAKADSPSDKPSDGYETCVEESLSEDNKSVETITKFHETDSEVSSRNLKVQSRPETGSEGVDDGEVATPTNSKVDLLGQIFLDVPDIGPGTVNVAVSEPCLSKDFFSNYRHICLDTKTDDGLKSYDNRRGRHGDDEFFLVEYPSESCKEAGKSVSEPNVLEGCESAGPTVYKKCLKEYYNDYADCLEAYNFNLRLGREEDEKMETEMSDDDIFNEILLPFKSRSTPDIMDSSFVTLTYDPGPEMNRRKSAFIPGYRQPHESEMTVVRPLESDVKGCHVAEMLQKHWGSTHTVNVFREPNRSLGINIVGGKVDLQSPEHSSDTLLGIFVKNVVPNSPAGKTGEFKTGDRILEVGGVDLREASHEKAVQAIRNATNPVAFLIQSLVPWDSNKNDVSFCAPSTKLSLPDSSILVKNGDVGSEKETNETKMVSNDVYCEKADVVFDEPPDRADLSPVVAQVVPIHSPQQTNTAVLSSRDSVSDDDEEKPEPQRTFKGDSDEGSEDDEDDARDMEGTTVSPKGQPIDRASAANLRRSKEEIAADNEDEDDFGYTTNKVKKKYASLGHRILMVQLERSKGGLGLSLAGHKDRSCMAVFVCGLNPNGAAFKAGSIQIGDEILEVNGVVLHGRCHLNASAIIKGLSGPTFKVIILRRKTAIDDIAVKPITQFPVSLAEEASEEQFSASYPNVRTIAIKKQANQSLGIMIIEGKHAEVGQGIFISDIQEGSSAEKAGLEIGEMILAVNKDSLVGSNYDMAAGLLKRTEGLVTLVVANPGKKDLSPSPAASPAAAALSSSAADNAAVENNRNAVANALKPSAPPSRSATPVPEPVADPGICPIVPGRDVTIEIVTENKGLGIFFVGGKDTQIPNGIVIVEVYPGGMVDKDKRLQPGDQLLEINGTSLKDVSYTTASQAMRQTLPKMKMVVHRPATIDFTTIEADLIKKPGKGLGLSVLARKSGLGVYIADIISGGTADVDGRITKGDLLISVNGQNIENVSGEEAGAILKTVVGKVSLKLQRYKPVAR